MVLAAALSALCLRAHCNALALTFPSDFEHDTEASFAQLLQHLEIHATQRGNTQVAEQRAS
jgi:hypothetical protein